MTNIHDFEIGKSLGSGSVAHVYLAREKISQNLFAMKVFFDKHKSSFEKERVLYYVINHPNIIRLISTFEYDEKYFMVMEYASKGDLMKLMKETTDRRFSALVAKNYLLDTAEALKYLNDNLIVHRDLKPENIVVTSDDKAKLIDFGWSVQLISESERLNDFCGTMDYLAPEVLEGNYGIEIDRWMFGVLVYELLTGCCPFYNRSDLQTRFRIKSVVYVIPECIGLEGRELIEVLLKKEVKDRIGWDEILVRLECLDFN